MLHPLRDSLKTLALTRTEERKLICKVKKEEICQGSLKLILLAALVVVQLLSSV